MYLQVNSTVCYYKLKSGAWRTSLHWNVLMSLKVFTCETKMVEIVENLCITGSTGMHFSQTTPSFTENVTSIKCELGWSVGIFTRCCISYFPISTIVLCFVMRSNTLNSLTDCEAMKQNYLKAQLTDTSFFYTVSHSVCKIQNVAESWQRTTIYGHPAQQMRTLYFCRFFFSFFSFLA